MKHKALFGGSLILLVGLFMAACTAPMLTATADPSPLLVQQGIDSALPHAKGILMQSCVEEGCELRLVDPATGNELAGYAPFSLGKYANYALTPDGKTLAAVVYQSNNFSTSGGPSGGTLQLIDLQAWRAITTTLTFNEGGGSPAFSPDGTRLALVGFNVAWPRHPLLHIVDVTRNVELGQLPLDFRPSRMRFTDDGRSILLYGNNMGIGAVNVNPQVYVAQISAADRTVVWQAVLPAHQDGLYNAAGSEPHHDPASSFTWQPAVLFAPQVSLLYIVHADTNALTTVNFEQRTVQTRPIAPQQSWLERALAFTAYTAKAKVLNGASKHAVIAPDGKTLYVAGVHTDFDNGTYVETPLGIQVIDLASAAEIAHIDSGARSLSLSADGRRLYLHCWENDPAKPYVVEWTEIVDTTTFQQVSKLENRAIALGRRLDGRPILLSTITRQDGQWEAATLDPTSLAVIHNWTNQQAGWWGWFVTQ